MKSPRPLPLFVPRVPIGKIGSGTDTLQPLLDHVMHADQVTARRLRQYGAVRPDGNTGLRERGMGSSDVARQLRQLGLSPRSPE